MLGRVKSGQFGKYFEGKMGRFASKLDVGCKGNRTVKNESKDMSEYQEESLNGMGKREGGKVQYVSN